MKKRLLCLVVTFCAALGFCLAARAAWKVDSGTCGDNARWTLDSDGVLTISGTGKINDEAFQGNDQIKSVQIGYGLTSVGEEAFYYCTRLTAISLPDSLTSIGWGAFWGCVGLTEIHLPDSLTSIGDYSFYDCTGLMAFEVNAGNRVLSSVDGVLYDKERTRLIYFPAGKQDASFSIPYSVKSIGKSAFYKCYGLTKIYLPDALTSIGEDAFYGCTRLTEIRLPDSLTTIGVGAFRNCTALTTFDVGAGNRVFSSVNGVLYNKDQTRLIYFPAGKRDAYFSIPDGVTSIGDSAFYGCTGLTEIDLPDSLTSIGSDTFSWCTGLTEISLPGSLTSIGYSAFEGCGGLTAFDVDAGNRAFSSVNGVLYDNERTRLIYFPAGKRDTFFSIPNGVTSIEYSAFRSCNSLVRVYLPDGLTSIGAHAFYNCGNLTEVRLPDGLTSIGMDAFSWCTSLKSISLPNGLTSISYFAFSNCGDLTRIRLPDDLTSIDDYAFSWCGGLTEISLPNSLTSIGNDAFYGCVNLVGVRYAGSKLDWEEIDGVSHAGFSENAVISYEKETPPDITWALDNYGLLTISGNGRMWNYQEGSAPWYERRAEIQSARIQPGVTSIGGNAFYGCTRLTEISLPDSLTSIGTGAFSDCGGLTKIHLPDSLTSISQYAFGGCSGLTEIRLPNRLTFIGDSAFYGCTRLTEISLPDSLTTISVGAFRNCAGLKSIHFPDSLTYISRDAFQYCGGLTEISLPDSLTTISIGAFQNCIGLTKINLPDSLIFIGGDAFSGCTRLTEISLPDSLTSIGRDVFQNCENLKDIWYAGSKAMWIECYDNFYNEYNADSDTLYGAAVHYGQEDIGVSVSLKDENGDNVTNLDDGQTIKPDISLVDPNVPDELKTVNLFLAFYDDGGMMVSLESWEINISDPNNIFWMNTLRIPEGAAQMKIMILSDELVPLRAARMLESA